MAMWDRQLHHGCPPLLTSPMVCRALRVRSCWPLEHTSCLSPSQPCPPAMQVFCPWACGTPFCLIPHPVWLPGMPSLHSFPFASPPGCNLNMTSWEEVCWVTLLQVVPLLLLFSTSASISYPPSAFLCFNYFICSFTCLLFTLLPLSHPTKLKTQTRCKSMRSLCLSCS